MVDSIGIVTVHDGPSLPPGRDHRPGRRQRRRRRRTTTTTTRTPRRSSRPAAAAAGSTSPLTDGTYFINRWFATVELIPKTVVPIGYVGVVVSYYGRHRPATCRGDAFRHGERVAEGERGVWERPLGPGKYAFNTYAGSIVLVPTTNFVLHWVTGKTETHRYDESLRSIDLVTQRRLRAAAAAVGRRAHRLPAGAERHPAVRRREEADHADARPDAQRLLPRHRPQEDDAGAAARARRDPARGPRRAAAQVPRVRHRVRRRADRQARHATRPAARSRRCSSSSASGSSRSSSSRPTSGSATAAEKLQDAERGRRRRPTCRRS